MTNTLFTVCISVGIFCAIGNDTGEHNCAFVGHCTERKNISACCHLLNFILSSCLYWSLSTSLYIQTQLHPYICRHSYFPISAGTATSLYLQTRLHPYNCRHNYIPISAGTAISLYILPHLRPYICRHSYIPISADTATSL